MPTFNEIVNGFAYQQTYERIQGVVHAALEDVHDQAVRIQALQQKPGMEGLLALAFPKLTKWIKEFEDEDRKEAREEAPAESGDTTPSLQDAGNLPTPTKGVSKHPCTQVPSSGLSAKSADFTTADLYRYTNYNI